MRKIQFDIKYRPEIESGRYKVVTRDGRNVRIICWDRRAGVSLVALIDTPKGEVVYEISSNGIYTPSVDRNTDLVILTDEPELTEFEEGVKQLMQIVSAYGSPDYVEDSDVKDRAKRLLDLAKKEILKDMPKWKKTPNSGTFVDASNILFHDGYYLGIKDLEKLPKED